MNFYPIKFAPRFVEKIWGGDALARVVDKQLPKGKKIGESWELFDFPPGSVGADGRAPDDDPNGWISARIVNGRLAGKTLHDLMMWDQKGLLGNAQPVETGPGPQFPLLIKFLDARQDLSVQVHPPESYTRAHPDAALKNECWHVIDHDANARILVGTKPMTTREAFAESIKRGECEQLINAVQVKKGDTYYLPSGTVHALGAGIVVAEVQTPSDTTYRVFDFNRVEPRTGKTRTLHVQQALDCIDFKSDATKNYVPAGEEDALVTDAPQFTLWRRSLQPGHRRASPAGSLRVMIIVEGSGRIGEGESRTPFARGDTILVPANTSGAIEAVTSVRWLEATPR